ncbi:MAG: Gfo/Idh/MocA family oxidoreductase [Chitinophagaceae bacterium]|nr:Gfo/Idh/MocA family oxidoreductase [Chitinophagaceae bacterium]
MSSRRKFLTDSSRVAAGGLLLSGLSPKVFAIHKSRFAAAGQLNIAAIGIKGMGWADTKSALKVQGVNLVGLCDVDKNVLDSRMNELSGLNVDASKVKIYGDYRKMLENKDIDAVIIGTPDHWHCLQMVEACQAGKHVYVEKPIGNSIVECRAMVAAQKRYNKAVQVGQWQRSQQHFRDAIEYVHSGKLGNIRTAKVWCYQGWMKPDIVQPDSAPPPGVDYAGWLGPAPKKPFNASRFHFNFRWFWDYAGGLMTDWGVHLLDYALFGMKADVPKTVVALGGKFAYPELAQETPDTLTTLYEFDKFNLVWDHAMGIDNGQYGRDHGIAFVGNNGTLVLDRGGWEIIEEKNSKNKVGKPHVKPSESGLDKHTDNFVSAIRSGQYDQLTAPIQVGADVAIVAQMGNIAFRSGKRVVWNKAAGKFTDDAINKEYLAKPYHNGYRIPVV